MRAVDDLTRTRVPGDVARRWRSALVLVASAVVLAGCYGGDDPARHDHLGFADGAGPVEDELTTLETVLIYGVTPLVILLVIAALAWLPGVVRSSRYRPAQGWTAPPLWFGGPADPAAAVESASTGDLVRGGASGSW